MSKLLRVKCPKCGTVQDLPADGPCWKCRTVIGLPQDGVIQIYRMTSCAWKFGAGMEVYLNGIHLGYLKNEDVIRIPVPYGHYQVMAKFLDYKFYNNKGQGVEFDLTPYNRIVFLKAARCIHGYGKTTVILEQAFAYEMKPL